jgi:hypothetical protein
MQIQSPKTNTSVLKSALANSGDIVIEEIRWRLLPNVTDEPRGC